MAASTEDADLFDRLRQNLIGSWECLSCTLTPISTHEKDAKDSETVHVLTEHPNGNLIYSSDGWMSALLQKPAGLLPKYAASSIGGTDEEILGVAKGTQTYSGLYGIEPNSVRSARSADGQDSEPRGYLSKLRKTPRTNYVRFRLYHDIKVGVPVNWFGEKQVRVGGDVGGRSRRRAGGKG